MTLIDSNWAHVISSTIRDVLAVTAAVLSVGCWPAHPSNERLAGTWEVDHGFGRETLVLNPDGTYKQIFRVADGRSAENTGRWSRGADKRLSFSGLKVILHDARVFDSASAVFEDDKRRSNWELETVTEWGRTLLIFDPDLPGFVKQ